MELIKINAVTLQRLQGFLKLRLHGGRVEALVALKRGPETMAEFAGNNPVIRPGAERDIFPHYEARRPLTVAYTATSWRKLLSRPKGWDGPLMSAGQCYRFCLSSPHVDVTLTGPKNLQQLDDNLRALEDGPLSADEEAWIRPFGQAVHG